MRQPGYTRCVEKEEGQGNGQGQKKEQGKVKEGAGEGERGGRRRSVGQENEQGQ